MAEKAHLGRAMTCLFYINLVADAALLVHAVCVINHMSRRTNHLIRLAYILLAVGALGVTSAPLFGYLTPLAAETMIKIGTGMALIVGTYRRQKKGWPQ
jgi:ABC-type polysaccharide/polyol phosphate export permease